MKIRIYRCLPKLHDYDHYFYIKNILLSELWVALQSKIDAPLSGERHKTCFIRHRQNSSIIQCLFVS